MPGELSRYRRMSAVERRQEAELLGIDHVTELAEAQVEGIARVTRRALFETLQTSMLRQKAEQLAPDGAELYAMLMVAGTMEMGNVISGLSRKQRR
ncbi:hypothetical protein [Fodinicola acaciae]|uniref:hypothetical protein n=1 Tax=Fodinicola acaciae TaxID=2681555 RepID=UPI0013D4BFA1|nr:hypothetical protein [Fodinicola acaciae]